MHFWSLEINDYNFNQLHTYFYFLSQKEKGKFDSFKFDQDKKNFLISRLALRTIIMYYTYITPEAIQYKYNEYSRPYLTNHFESNNLFLIYLILMKNVLLH